MRMQLTLNFLELSDWLEIETSNSHPVTVTSIRIVFKIENIKSNGHAE